MSTVDTNAATRRRDRIKLLIESMVEHREKVLTLITEAREGDDHLALGYKSWPEYVSTEFGGLLSQLTREDRRETVLALSATGMSTRAIAPVVGVSKDTVHRDLAGVSHETPDEGDITEEEFSAATDVSDEEFEVALAAARADGDLSRRHVAEHLTEKIVTGIDGKKYTSVQPALPRVKPRKRPLPDAYRSAVYDLDKAMARLVRLTEDDRFGKYRDQVSFNSGDLARIGKNLWTVRKALTDGEVQ